MAEDRELSNLELKERYGVTLDGADRRRLNDLKFVESRKQGRAFAHVLTDRGWRHAGEIVQGGLPSAGSGSGGKAVEAALRAIVGNLGRGLERNKLSLADLFGQEENLGPTTRAECPAADVTSSGAPAAPRASGSASPASSTAATATDKAPGADAPGGSGVPPTDQDIEARIRTAYRELVGGSAAWVSLSRLRPLLGGDVTKAQVDRVLRRMNRMPDVQIVPESNQKMLTKEERAAAVTIGGQPKHLIRIGA